MEWNTSYIFSTVQNKEHFSKIIFLHYILCILLPRTLPLRRDSYILPLVQGGGSIVGWSDLQLFAILKKDTLLPIRNFLWVKFQKSANSAARQCFHFQKITETLKINIFLWKFANTFLIHQRTLAKWKF